jgi:uncharacterized protein YejL (UPF0352 family)
MYDDETVNRFVERLATQLERGRAADDLSTMLNHIDALLDAARWEPADEYERRLR